MSGHRHLARVRAQTIQELLLESCPTFRRRRPGAAAPAATVCLPRRRPQTAAGGQHTQIGSGAAGAPPALETTKGGGRRVTIVLRDALAASALAQQTRHAVPRRSTLASRKVLASNIHSALVKGAGVKATRGDECQDGRASRSPAGDGSTRAGQGGSPPNKRRDASPSPSRRPGRHQTGRGRLPALRLPVGPSYGEATQRRIRGAKK